MDGGKRRDVWELERFGLGRCRVQVRGGERIGLNPEMEMQSKLVVWMLDVGPLYRCAYISFCMIHNYHKQKICLSLKNPGHTKCGVNQDTQEKSP